MALLCVKDDEGKTGPFLNEIKKWVQQQMDQYIGEIKQQLGDVSQVSVDDLKRAVGAADPVLDPDILDSYVMWTFGVESDEALAEAQPLDVARVVERLHNGNVMRGGKRE